MLYRLALADGTEVMPPQEFDIAPPLHSVFHFDGKDYEVQAEPPHFDRVKWGFPLCDRWCATFVVKPAIEVTPSSGNVFADLGLPDADEKLKQAEARVAAARDEVVVKDVAKGGKVAKAVRRKG